MGKKIVLDTNVIVSAFGWKGSAHEIFQKCIKGHFQLYLSPQILSEIKRVLSYHKFHFNQDEIDEFLSIIIEAAEIVEPEIIIDLISQDSSNNRVLECAITADCEYVISGDKHLLEIKEFESIKILSPDKFKKFI
jgi:putative PIN family toxin of toxin-antitoxin system